MKMYELPEIEVVKIADVIANTIDEPGSVDEI